MNNHHNYNRFNVAMVELTWEDTWWCIGSARPIRESGQEAFFSSQRLGLQLRSYSFMNHESRKTIVMKYYYCETLKTT